jgi:hypothetical protein
MVSMVTSGLKTLFKPNSHDCTLALIMESGWLHTSLSMSGFRDKQRTLVNTVSVPGLQVQVPARAGGNVKIWPNNQTDHPTQVPQDITLGLLWPKFTYKYCIQNEIIKYKGKVPVNKKIYECMSMSIAAAVLYLYLQAPDRLHSKDSPFCTMKSTGDNAAVCYYCGRLHE